MSGIQYEDLDDALDVGKTLREEKKREENQQKIEKIKEEYNAEQASHISQENNKKSNAYLFLVIIFLVAILLRVYAAQMPVTESWAEEVVSQNLHAQAQNQIELQYPTFSDAKKEELAFEGTRKALSAAQNQQAIQSLTESYKESYKDPEGTAYLYEIDPYYFYNLAQQDSIQLNAESRLFLPFFEKNFFLIVSFFLPFVSFTGVIAYIPLLFLLLSALCMFLLGTLVWNEKAGLIAALLFVIHPILLEFTLIGFTDTNMLNIFFVLSTGVLFLYAGQFLHTKKQYAFPLTAAIALGILGLFLLFRVTWSGWYIAPLLILLCLILFFGMKIIPFGREQGIITEQKVRQKKLIGIGIGISFLLLILGIYWGLQMNLATAQSNIVTYTPQNLARYLHISAKNSLWPDGFSLIKELRQVSGADMVGYMGGALYVCISFFVLLFLGWKFWKKNSLSVLYIWCGYVIFLVLSFRAIRLFPYFLPFFAVTIGVGLEQIISYAAKQIHKSLQNEKKIFQRISLLIFYVIVGMLFLYPIFGSILEKTKIMPIMDDAIYNSATFLRETSSENAIISAWWDRGTFYTALAERTVHLRAQPYMPRTYWLASFYMTPDEVTAKNIMRMINCQKEEGINNKLSEKYSQKETMAMINAMLQVDDADAETYAYTSVDAAYMIHQMERCGNKDAESYVVVIDDLMQRLSAVEYFAAWDFAAQQPDPRYPYTDLEDGGCERTQSGAYCTVNNANFFLNFTSMEVKANIPVPEEVYLVFNGSVQHQITENAAVNHVLVVYQRAGYWKALYVPKEIADSMYVRLMILDGYNLNYFEKVFDEVHAETSWVKVYKMNWNPK